MLFSHEQRTQLTIQHDLVSERWHSLRTTLGKWTQTLMRDIEIQDDKHNCTDAEPSADNLLSILREVLHSLALRTTTLRRHPRDVNLPAFDDLLDRLNVTCADEMSLLQDCWCVVEEVCALQAKVDTPCTRCATSTALKTPDSKDAQQSEAHASKQLADILAAQGRFEAALADIVKVARYGATVTRREEALLSAVHLPLPIMGLEIDIKISSIRRATMAALSFSLFIASLLTCVIK